MDKSIARMITVVSRKSQSYLSTVLSKHNLTTAEQPFFAALQEADDVTQEELSTLLNIDKAAAARTVKSLEQKGFVICSQDKNNRRKNRVLLTDKARECWPSIKRELLHYNELLSENIDAHSLDIVYNALLQMEENAVNLAKNKEAISASKEEGIEYYG